MLCPPTDLIGGAQPTAAASPPSQAQPPDPGSGAESSDPSPAPVAISPIVGPGGGVVGSPDGRVYLTVPPGAVERTTTITITPVARSGATPRHLFYLFQIEAVDDLGAVVSTFARPITATFLFRSADLVGLPDGSPALFWHNPASDAWESLPGRVDWGQGMVTVALQHFSDFGGGVASVVSYGAQDLPTVHGFSSDDWSGASSVNYPLTLPPGPGKLGLSLSLSYSSESVNGIRAGDKGGDQTRANTFNRQAGIAGWGWNLLGHAGQQHGAPGPGQGRDGGGRRAAAEHELPVHGGGQRQPSRGQQSRRDGQLQLR
jgi:hypothetical protein